MKLKETNHSYYCEAWETSRRTEVGSWKQFVEEVMGYDFDYNLPFRFDITYYDPKDYEDLPAAKLGTYMLSLNHALQRHGCELWHIVINNIQEEDMEEVNAYLKTCKEHLLSMWKEIK